MSGLAVQVAWQEHKKSGVGHCPMSLCSLGVPRSAAAAPHPLHWLSAISVAIATYHGVLLWYRWHYPRQRDTRQAGQKSDDPIVVVLVADES